MTGKEIGQATIRDVAREADVSVASVSRVFNRLPNVRPELKERVEQAARKLNYVPHAGARNLSMARTGAIGVVLPDLHGEYFSEMLRGMEREAALHQRHLLLSNMHLDIGHGIDALRNMRGRVDGLIVMAPHMNLDALFAQQPPSIPAVLLNCQDNGQGRPELRVDNVAGAGAMVRHLIDCGRRAIVHVEGPAGNVEAADRARGYVRAMEAAGLKPVILPGNFDEESGRRAVDRLQAEQIDVDAIFAANDMTAIGVMVALRDMGVDVPTQVAVAGFDNIPLARLVSPGLTTMAVDIADMGARGINRLVALIDGEAVPQMELRQPGLIIRNSSQLSAA
ncbi:LacI family DNA-binding transcriptional regulator [Sphingobium abikonense]|uniref:LacI family DNA-binding transcriptional regulator n=1 Tax=Sphingobium abikonense TaxID=86193 RepID=UPI003516DB2B